MNRFATSSEDGVLRVHDVDPSEIDFSYQETNRRFTEAAFSPDGTRLAFISDTGTSPRDYYNLGSTGSLSSASIWAKGCYQQSHSVPVLEYHRWSRTNTPAGWNLGERQWYGVL
jgi:WD40 repeat protein